MTASRRALVDVDALEGALTSALVTALADGTGRALRGRPNEALRVADGVLAAWQDVFATALQRARITAP